MLLGHFFSSIFVFSIVSLILSGSPLTSFHLAESSPSTFSWLYTHVCEVVQKYQKCLLFIIIHISSTHFAINLFCLHNLKRKQATYGTTTAPCM